MADEAVGREVPEPSDAFRRTAMLLGILALEATSLLWTFWGGAFSLLPEPSPASWMGTSRNLLPLAVGMSAVVVLMYRRQEDMKAGRRPGMLFRLTLYASLLAAFVGGVRVAGNLAWVVKMI